MPGRKRGEGGLPFAIHRLRAANTDVYLPSSGAIIETIGKYPAYRRKSRVSNLSPETAAWAPI